MNRILSLTVFLLKDFSRSLRVVVPPGLLLALYRVFSSTAETYRISAQSARSCSALSAL